MTIFYFIFRLSPIESCHIVLLDEVIEGTKQKKDKR